MSRSLTYIWPASNTTDVCKSQSLAAAGNLVLNGNLANQTNSAVTFTDYGYIRSVVIRSDTNGAFTINGTQNGFNIREVMNVVANTPLQSTNVFDTISSISVNGAIANVSVGSGYKGFFKLIGVNLERDVINYSLSVAKLTEDSIGITLHQAFSDIEGNGHLFSDIILNNFNVLNIETVTEASYVLEIPTALKSPLCKSFLVQIIGTVATAANSLQLNFIQT